MDPEHKFVKSHFYAARKNIFGRYYSTFWVNTCVIWFMSIICFIILYYRGLKKFLDYMEQLSGKWKKT